MNDDKEFIEEVVYNSEFILEFNDVDRYGERFSNFQNQYEKRLRFFPNLKIIQPTDGNPVFAFEEDGIIYELLL